MKYSNNKKDTSENPDRKTLFSSNKLPSLFTRFLHDIFPLPEISLWKSIFLGNKLPPVYRPHLRLVAAFKMKTRLSWNPSKDSIQLDLTSFCNLSCPNCERSIGQAPCREYISLEQIEKFVNESIELKSEWKAISLIGGEPTLHPQFFEVLDILKRYKDINPNCFIIVWTNGYGNKVNKILSSIT